MSASAVYEDWVRHRRFEPVEHSFRYRFFRDGVDFFDDPGTRMEAVVADVETIPWGERHAYVLARGEKVGPVLSDELDKTLHLSPLMGMDQAYAFRATEPGARYFPHPEGSRPKGFLSP